MLFFLKNRIKNIRTAWKCKRPQIAKAILRKKNEAGVTARSVFKLCARVTIIKVAYYWQKKRHADQWNRTENPKIKP